MIALERCQLYELHFGDEASKGIPAGIRPMSLDYVLLSRESGTIQSNGEGVLRRRSPALRM